MAKAEKEKEFKSRTKTYENPIFNDEFLETLKERTPMMVVRILTTLFADGPYPQPWDKEFKCSFCPTLIGSPGIGKSVILSTTAQRLGFDYVRIPMGDQPEGDLSGVCDPHNLDHQGLYVMRMPNFMKLVKPPEAPSGRGLACLDEIASCGPMLLPTLSIMLTDGYRTGISGHRIAPGWFLAATMNPEEPVRHNDQQHLSDKVRNRLMPIRVVPDPREIIYFLSQDGRTPERLYNFYQMNADHLLDWAPPRKWEAISALAHRYYDGEKLTMKEDFLTLVRGLSNDAVGPLITFLTLGEDPLCYPLSAQAIRRADKETHKEHLRRMEAWKKNGSDSLIGLTALDIGQLLSDRGQAFSDQELNNLADIIDRVPPDLIPTILGSKDTPSAARMVNRLSTREALVRSVVDMEERNYRRQQDDQKGRRS